MLGILCAIPLLGASIPDEPAALKPITIFPKPSSLVRLPGSYTFPKNVQIVTSADCKNEAERLAELIANAGVRSSAVRAVAKPYNPVYLKLDSSLKGLGDEGYSLGISPRSVVVRARKPAGIFYGIQTLRQMMPPSIERVSDHPYRLTLPCVNIVDRPRFGWRGMLLDVSRHFFDKAQIERFLDLMAMHKLNVFHWHLTDDGGWRLEIKKYPKLTEIGAWRNRSKEIWDYGNIVFPGKSNGEQLYGGYYTQDEVREIVKYASDRHITIVPEIEMPGHSLAAMYCYPDLACTGFNLAEYRKESALTGPNVWCAGKDSTFKFVEGVLDEVMALFPSKYIHIGGDEVDKWLWTNCTDCQLRMQKEHLKDPEALQSYFIRRIERYINSKGRKLVGWDEILEGGLAPNAVVMSWRGISGGITAAKSGHDVVMSPTSHCYFDYAYSTISTELALQFDPVPPGVDPKRILGGQCNLWTEWVADMPTAEQRLFPRTVSMAEALWSENRDRDPNNFDLRLEPYYDRLAALNVNFYVRPPKADYDAAFLQGPTGITFHDPRIPGAIIRYTADGSDPQPDSPRYQGPITLDRPVKLKAALFVDGIRSDTTQVDVVAAATAPKESLLEAGLDWKLCDGYFEKFDQAKGPWVVSGVAPDAAIVGGKKENYALSFRGYLKIEKDGPYTFYLNSDDGSVLWLGDAKLVDNDGLHAAMEKSGRIYLHPGLFPIAIGFMQAGGEQSLSASIEGPEIKKQPIGKFVYRVKSER